MKKATLLLLLFACGVLWYGSSWQFSRKDVDAAIYQCYAVAFWQGQPGLQSLPHGQCSFLEDKSILDEAIESMEKHHVPHSVVQLAPYQESVTQFHTLPREYPVLSLVTFSLPLIAPPQFYQQAYAIIAMLLIIVLYVVIKRVASEQNALFFLACMAVAGYSTALSRFDMFPSALSLVALLLARKGKWTGAYACIALGTLLKFYPALLLPVFLIAEQKESVERWYVLSRWKAILLGFVATFIISIFISFTISIPGTIGSLKYFQTRPLEIESLPASFIWLAQYIGFPYHYLYAYTSMNVVSTISGGVGIASTMILVVGLLWVFWKEWEGRVDLGLACLTTIVLALATSKILSPQYLLWVIPLVAYVGKPTRLWVAIWGTVMVLTLLIYPVVYTWSSPPPTVIFLLGLARGLILLGFAGTVLVGTKLRLSCRICECS
jgi:Glycosyltransferase family 87